MEVKSITRINTIASLNKKTTYKATSKSKIKPEGDK
jgi:hypothetical protein